ncbi:MAG: SRPBCC domain-containing protein [Oceanospirillaceae bacterium]
MKMNAIHWPVGYVPGFTENFCSNEVIIADLCALDVWSLLIKAPLWPSYYANSANVRFYDDSKFELEDGVHFYFETFGFPIEAQCNEYVAPTPSLPGRIAWHGYSGEGDARIDVHHAWLVEDLSDGRVRILTQETQKGKIAEELARTKPNPMINGHQDWLEGLVLATRKLRS